MKKATLTGVAVALSILSVAALAGVAFAHHDPQQDVIDELSAGPVWLCRVEPTWGYRLCVRVDFSNNMPTVRADGAFVSGWPAGEIGRVDRHVPGLYVITH